MASHVTGRMTVSASIWPDGGQPQTAYRGCPQGSLVGTDLAETFLGQPHLHTGKTPHDPSTSHAVYMNKKKIYKSVFVTTAFMSAI